MIKDYLKLSYGSIKNRKLRSWLTLIGILIGIAAVVSLIGLGEGLRHAVSSQFDFLSPDILTVQASGLAFGPPGDAVINPLNKNLVDKVEKINGVKMAIGRIIESTSLEFNDVSDFTFAGSMPKNNERRKEIKRILNFKIAKGRDLRAKDKGAILLGNNYASSDRFGKVIQPRDKVLVNGKEFKVIGILAKKGNFLVDNIIVMNEDELIETFNSGENYDIITAIVSDVNSISLVKGRIENLMRKERNVDKGQEDFIVESAENTVSSINATLFAIQIFIYIIASISIIVGGIGIANTMYTSVIERTKQIGVMKSIGAKNRDIFTLFLIESGFLGLVGGIFGIVLGLSLAYGLAFIGQIFMKSDLIAVKVSPFLILGALAFSFLIGTFAGILPAYRASKLKPVDALRYTT